MPLTPQGTYPRSQERIGTAQQLQVRPNPPAALKNKPFQHIYLVPAKLPKWLRDGIKVALTEGGFTGAESVYRTLRPMARRWPQERFLVLYLDVKNKPKAVVEITIGTLDASLVHPRDVFGGAVASAAASMILIHNHPSGDPEPSAEDLAVTRRLADLGDMMGIPVLDHIILGRQKYVSLAERGVV